MRVEKRAKDSRCVHPVVDTPLSNPHHSRSPLKSRPSSRRRQRGASCVSVSTQARNRNTYAPAPTTSSAPTSMDSSFVAKLHRDVNDPTSISGALVQTIALSPLVAHTSPATSQLLPSHCRRSDALARKYHAPIIDPGVRIHSTPSVPLHPWLVVCRGEVHRCYPLDSSDPSYNSPAPLLLVLVHGRALNRRIVQLRSPAPAHPNAQFPLEDVSGAAMHADGRLAHVHSAVSRRLSFSSNVAHTSFSSRTRSPRFSFLWGHPAEFDHDSQSSSEEDDSDATGSQKSADGNGAGSDEGIAEGQDTAVPIGPE
ncbi:hypothetical protein C8F01DRAFT_1377825 [Mycena amicta]|nr:hypothetical protein C8F01DRAFT_1377825 [Mycena amicta]